MASLDVTWIPLCAEFSDAFEVVRRPEQISQFGRVELNGSTIVAYGTIYPTGDNSLVRKDDHQRAAKTLTVVTPFRLHMSAPGMQPDLILYRGNTFIVSAVRDYTQFGAGFIEAECSSIEAQDLPPQ
jgi:galactose-6-phosphate isomerase